MAGIDAVWIEFDDLPDMLARGWILRDPDEDYGIPYDSQRLHEHGALVVGGAGISHHPSVAQDPAFAPGRYLQLRLEPDNPVDPNAVAIWDAESRLQIGYVPSEYAPEIAQRLRAGEQPYALCLMEFVGTASGDRRGIRLLIAPRAFRLNFRSDPQP
jgi:HIRAN domain-containing protein